MTSRTDHLAGMGVPSRMLVLSSLDLDNPDLRHQLDTISERTARRFGVPASVVVLVLDTAQIFVGSYGVEGWIAAVQGTPVEWSFCSHAVATGEPYIVPDAAVDPDQSDIPLVTVDGIRSYAGMPLKIDGQVVGAHCVIGATARSFDEDELAELRRNADEITELLNRHRVPAA